MKNFKTIFHDFSRVFVSQGNLLDILSELWNQLRERLLGESPKPELKPVPVRDNEHDRR